MGPYNNPKFTHTGQWRELTALEWLKFYREVPPLRQARGKAWWTETPGDAQPRHRDLPDLPGGFNFYLTFDDNDNPDWDNVDLVEIVHETAGLLVIATHPTAHVKETAYELAVRAKKALIRYLKEGKLQNLDLHAKQLFLTQGWVDQLLQK